MTAPSSSPPKPPDCRAPTSDVDLALYRSCPRTRLDPPGVNALRSHFPPPISTAFGPGNAAMWRIAFPKPPKPLSNSERWDRYHAWFTLPESRHNTLRHVIDQFELQSRVKPKASSLRGHRAAPDHGRRFASLPQDLTKRNRRSDQTMAKDVMIPVIVNLLDHVDGTRDSDVWTRYAPPPAWCIDHTPNAGTTLLGHGWNPPKRVGRDRRYPASQHKPGRQ